MTDGVNKVIRMEHCYEIKIEFLRHFGRTHITIIFPHPNYRSSYGPDPNSFLLD